MASESAPVALARQSLEHYLAAHEHLPTPAGLPAELEAQAGVFVSLKKRGELRGCIGTFAPTQPNIAAEIIHNAVSAGTQDPRFWPVEAKELPEIDISVDILSAPERVNGLADLDPGKYGVIVRRGRRSGLLLPDLAGVDTVEEQVGIAMQKAGIEPGEEIELYRFSVTRYGKE
ncbi:AmmeMemoRadiSam system protein A [Anaeroselena agilis]|uniref:AmmeMemoRadiSam system protein A n=1 Tax=Anaeroselena agilis TaxID=3063788 RepID=A0ABU3P3F0_9FIRM|nr:AmmeMemoRadiSam system protein A [Selenomonadales bacterium 4137-cl]